MLNRTAVRVLCLLASFCLLAAFQSASLAAAPLENLAARSAVAPTQGREDALETARSIAEEVLRHNNLPGLSVTVVRRGQEVFSQGFGSSDLEQDVPVTPQTLFRIGSLSKLVTVAAMARLKEQGKLDWDASPRDYLQLADESPLAHSPMTLRQLASHTAGVRHYLPGDPQGCGSFVGPQGGIRLQGWDDLEAALDLFADDDLVHPPGEAYHYSTFGYTLLGAVMEKVAGQSFEALIRQQVFDPLDMEGSTTDRNIPLIEKRSEFYILHPETGQIGNAPCNDSSYKWPGGGLLSSTSEFAAFASAHLGEGFLQSSTLEEIFTPQPKASDRDYQVGLGWRIGKDGQGRTIYHHGGAIMGGRAFVLAYPQERLVVVLFANAFARFGRPEALRLAQLFMPQ
ncbi:MAG TPA: serine hydrolase domain-containing protein [Acidobacteriota bacterium]|nr:serine hydrolase domain-containing protein [Acidobacteriota bacterium]